MNGAAPGSAPEGVRADVWLWAARFFKTRSLAKQAVQAGKLRINGTGAKPGKLIKPGDRLRIERGEECFEVEVRALSERRGPAAEAQALYEEGDASRLAREAERRRRAEARQGFEPPPQRPDKKARRALRGLRDGAPKKPPWMPD